MFQGTSDSDESESDENIRPPAGRRRQRITSSLDVQSEETPRKRLRKKRHDKNAKVTLLITML